MKNAINERKTYTLDIYNHATGKVETVEVTEEVYRTYKRTEWSIENNDASFYAHEIQFSSLIGGGEDAFQNFREFIDTENTPDKIIERSEIIAAVHRAINGLPLEEQELVWARFFDRLSLRQYAQLRQLPLPYYYRSYYFYESQNTSASNSCSNFNQGASEGIHRETGTHQDHRQIQVVR